MQGGIAQAPGGEGGRAQHEVRVQRHAVLVGELRGEKQYFKRENTISLSQTYGGKRLVNTCWGTVITVIVINIINK